MHHLRRGRPDEQPVGAAESPGADGDERRAPALGLHEQRFPRPAPQGHLLCGDPVGELAPSARHCVAGPRARNGSMSVR